MSDKEDIRQSLSSQDEKQLKYSIETIFRELTKIKEICAKYTGSVFQRVTTVVNGVSTQLRAFFSLFFKTQKKQDTQVSIDNTQTTAVPKVPQSIPETPRSRKIMKEVAREKLASSDHDPLSLSVTLSQEETRPVQANQARENSDLDEFALETSQTNISEVKVAGVKAPIATSSEIEMTDFYRKKLGDTKLADTQKDSKTDDHALEQQHDKKFSSGA